MSKLFALEPIEKTRNPVFFPEDIRLSVEHYAKQGHPVERAHRFAVRTGPHATWDRLTQRPERFDWEHWVYRIAS